MQWELSGSWRAYATAQYKRNPPAPHPKSSLESNRTELEKLRGSREQMHALQFTSHLSQLCPRGGGGLRTPWCTSPRLSPTCSILYLRYPCSYENGWNTRQILREKRSRGPSGFIFIAVTKRTNKSQRGRGRVYRLTISGCSPSLRESGCWSLHASPQRPPSRAEMNEYNLVVCSLTQLAFICVHLVSSRRNGTAHHGGREVGAN